MIWPKNNPDKEKKRSVTRQGISAVPKDIFLGFKFALNHFLAYFLAMLGIIILTVIMLLVVLLFVVVPLVLFVGIPAIVFWITSFSIQVGTLEGTVLIAIILLFVLPILGPFFVALGSLYGMSREIIESETTSAESAFSWYKKRALSLVGGGVIHFLVSLTPFIIAIWVIFATSVTGPTNDTLRIILPIGVIWIILTNGMLSLTFPGIIDGLSAASAAKLSVRQCCRSPGRVLGAWSFYALLIGVPIIAQINDPLFEWLHIIPSAYLEPYKAIIVLLILFVILPAMTITFSRIYLILTAQDDDVYDNDDRVHHSIISEDEYTEPKD
ncbi:MAG: hypothetical protein KAU48_05770 [Candidatus Thorarchaeota archaeon]|nr:hypothetical protein [Candidatus Thorarchaeota archaeon]